MVYHYGTFVFKQGVTPAQIDTCFAEMRGMVGKIPGLLSMQHGVYQSGDRYLPHPEHERVKLIVVPNLERVMVFDFTV
jgi:hypothetical protein